nr:flagellar hook capping FlgD N-terminal domain-containing protein [uncultured Oscillibacter sp.]
MGDFMSDLGNYYKDPAVTGTAGNKKVNIQKKGSNTELDMTDFIQLMITQLTNQGIDESVDTSDMLNQMIQMQMVETMANLTDASVMSYAASLVGQMVTVGKYDSEGNLQEIYGQVTGTGTMNGNQVVFIDNGEYYQMNEILAVGKLPPKKEEVEDPEKPGEGEKPEGPEEPGEGEKPEGPGEPEGPQEPGGADGPEYGGEDGAPDNQGA